MELREYQIEAVDIIETMVEGENRLIALPTASGKTVIFSSVAAKAKGKVLIIVPSKELRIQAIDKLKKLDPDCDVGSVQANINEFDHKICVATRQSLSHKKSTRLEKMLELGEFEYAIFDEVHMGLDQIKLILNKLNNDIKICGFTATPYSDKLKDIFDKISYGKSILEMIKNGYLCEPRAFQIQTDQDISNVKTVAGEFNQKSLQDAIDTPYRNKQIVDAYLKYAKDRKHTVIFTAGIEHSNNIMDAFNERGINCKTVNSKTDKDDREELLDAFAKAKFPVITNCNILTVGWDLEKLDCIILASPTKSKTKYVQQIGRGLRIHPSKSDCLILDMKDTIKTHDLMSMDDVFGVKIKNGETPTEAEERLKEEIIEKQIADQKAEEELIVQQELYAQEVALFNANLGNTLDETSSYDWWKVCNDTYALSINTDYHYVIEKDKYDDQFYVYEINSLKDHNSIELINSGSNAIDMIDFVENQMISKITSFMLRTTPWKSDPATAAQVKAIQYAVVENKWDCHIYFSNWKIKKIMKGLKIAG